MFEAANRLAEHPRWALLAAVLLAGLPSLGAGFRMDDFALRESANEAALSLPSLGAAYALDARSIHDGWLPEPVARFRISYFRPLALLYCKLNILLWNDWAPGFHLTNLLLHFMACYLVFVLAQSLGLAKGIALLAALLFAWFPQNAVPVPWISTSGELLVTVFSLVAVLSYFRYRGGRGGVFAGMTLFSLGLALLAKEYAVALPLLLVLEEALLCTRWPNAERRRAQATVLLILSFGILAGYLLLRHHVLGDTDLPPSTKYFCPPFEPGCQMFAVQKVLYGLLMLFLFLPALEGPFSALAESLTLTALCAGALVALAVAYQRRIGWDRALLFALGWSVLFLLPTAPFFPAPWHVYVPSVGSCIVLAGCLASTAAHRAGDSSSRRARWPAVVASTVLAVSLALFLGFCALAYLFNRRQEAYVDSISRELARATDARRVFFLDMKIGEYDLIQSLRMRLRRRPIECHILSVTHRSDPPSFVRQRDERSFEVEARGTPYVVDLAWAAPRNREPGVDVFPGKTVRVRDYQIQVEEVGVAKDAGAAATRLRYQFDQRLADPGNVFFQMLPTGMSRIRFE